MPNVQSIGTQTFNGTQMSVFDFPELISCGKFYGNSTTEGAFAENSVVTTFTASKLHDLGAFLFDGCPNLSEVNLPALTSTGTCAFRSCTALTSIDLPYAQTAAVSLFYNAGISTITMPYCRHIGSYAFAECSSLSWASFGESVNDYLSSTWRCDIASNAFENCTNLESVTLLGRYWSLPYSNPSMVFAGTPIASGSGAIYVDSYYYDDFMSAACWSWASAFIHSINS